MSFQCEGKGCRGCSDCEGSDAHEAFKRGYAVAQSQSQKRIERLESLILTIDTYVDNMLPVSFAKKTIRKLISAVFSDDA